MFKKFIIWLIFTIIVPFLPFAGNYLVLLFKGAPITLPMLFKNGELLLISLLVNATGVGSIIINNNKSRLKIIIGTFCVVALIFTALLYGFIYSEIGLDQKFNIEMLFNFSKWIFIFSTIISGSCILIPEE